MFDDHRKDVPGTLTEFGGKFVVRGGKLTMVEGDWPHQRTVAIASPSGDAAESWYQSPAHQKVLPLRLGSASGNFVIVDGAD